MAGNEVEPVKGDKKNEDANPNVEEKPKQETLGVEIGVELNLPFSAPFHSAGYGVKKTDDEELREILHEETEQWGPTVRQLVTMRRMDGQARALYRLITLPIRSTLTQATFVPADGGEAEAEFIEAVFRTPPESGGMTVTLHRFMSQMLQGIFDGFAAFEKVFWMPDHGPLKGKYTLKKIAHRPAETITFLTDINGGFAGLRQRSAGVDGRVKDIVIPKERAFYYAAQEEERKFYGVSFFQSAFYHYDKKVKLYYIAHLAAQRAAVGTRIGTMPANTTKEQKADFANQLNNLAFAQWMMMPEGFKVEVLKEGGNFDFLSMINHHNSQMSKSILAGFFDKEQGSGQSEGSLVNFAQPGDEMFMLMLRAVMDDIANQINHYVIPQLIDFNFHGGKYPTFTWGKLSDEQKAAIASTFDKLATAGQSATVTPEFMRAIEEHMSEEFGLEIDYDEVDARIEKEKAEAEELMAQQQEMADAAANPAGPDEDTQVSDFENEAMSLTLDSSEAYEDLMKLAGDLLDQADAA